MTSSTTNHRVHRSDNSLRQNDNSVDLEQNTQNGSGIPQYVNLAAAQAVLGVGSLKLYLDTTANTVGFT